MLKVRHVRKRHWKELWTDEIVIIIDQFQVKIFLNCILICGANMIRNEESGYQGKYCEQTGHCIKLNNGYSFFRSVPYI